MPDFMVTLEIAGALALINIWLAVRCGRARLQKKVLHGDAGDPMMQRRMRAHGNFTEYTPIVLILMGLIEYSLGSSWWLFVLGVIFVIGRLTHPFGLDRDDANYLRGLGAMSSLLVTLVLAAIALLTSWGIIA